MADRNQQIIAELMAEYFAKYGPDTGTQVDADNPLCQSYADRIPGVARGFVRQDFGLSAEARKARVRPLFDETGRDGR